MSFTGPESNPTFSVSSNPESPQQDLCNLPRMMTDAADVCVAGQVVNTSLYLVLRAGMHRKLNLQKSSWLTTELYIKPYVCLHFMKT